MPSHLGFPNSDEALRFLTSAVATWRGAIVRLSWAHEQPGAGPCTGTTIYHEEIIEARVKNCKVMGRRNGEESPLLSLILEIDTNLEFLRGQISHVVIEKDDGTAVVHFRWFERHTPASDTVRIERLA